MSYSLRDTLTRHSLCVHFFCCPENRGFDHLNLSEEAEKDGRTGGAASVTLFETGRIRRDVCWNREEYNGNHDQNWDTGNWYINILSIYWIILIYDRNINFMDLTECCGMSECSFAGHNLGMIGRISNVDRPKAWSSVRAQPTRHGVNFWRRKIMIPTDELHHFSEG